MLAGEAARDQVATYAASQAGYRMGVRVRTASAPELADDIVAALTEQRTTWPVRDERTVWQPVASTLDALSLGQREAVLSAIAPQLGADLARWWEWSARQPYQRGWDRRAYQSTDSNDSLGVRWDELTRLLEHEAHYPQPLLWHAEWALHLGQYVPLGSLFASAIAHGNREIAGVLTASLRGEHEISGPSYSAFVALLAGPNRDSWEEVGRLLVAAQRSEGLRQTILEACDLASTEAFAYVLDLTIEHKLTRFASTVRALGVWIGEELTVRQEKRVTEAIVTIRGYLRSPAKGGDLVEGEPADAFLGLWCLALHDVTEAIAAAEIVQGSANEGSRLAAARILADVAVPAAADGLGRAVADPSLAVFGAAIAVWPPLAHPALNATVPLPPEARRIITERIPQLGPVREVETGLIGRLPVKVGGALAADVLIAHSGGQPLDPVLVAAASADGRWLAASWYAENPLVNRAALFSLLGDRSSSVREEVGPAILSLPSISEDEARTVEDALRRKAADLRKLALSILEGQETVARLASIRRLSDGTAEQRRAAAELFGRQVEQTRTDEIPAAIRFTTDDRTPAVRPIAPDPRVWKGHHERFLFLWTSLTAWLAEHADVEMQTPMGVELLANVTWLPTRPGEIPIPEVIEPWWERIQAQLTDGGVELALLTLLPRSNSAWIQRVWSTVVGPRAAEIAGTESPHLQWAVLEALATYAKRQSWSGQLLDLLETAAAELPLDELQGPAEVLARRGRTPQRDHWNGGPRSDCRYHFRTLFGGAPELLTVAQLSEEELGRLWLASRFVDEPEGALDRWDGPRVEPTSFELQEGVSLCSPQLDQPYRLATPADIMVRAFDHQLASRADLIDALVRQDGVSRWGSAMYILSEPRRQEAGITSPRVQHVLDEVREAAVAGELIRGDLPTALSATAECLRALYGANTLIRVVKALGGRPLARGYVHSQTRESSLSQLIRINQPLATDTADELGRLVADARLSDQRLVEVAVYAPQWAALIGTYLDWSGLESAVWWLHAHTKDDSWSVDAEIRAQWASEVSQRTPLETVDLVIGTVDVEWFLDAVDALGEERFDVVLRAAKYASSAGGHKRAELFAHALLGRTDERDIRARILDKRHQDSVRALGLLPLDEDGDVLARYELLRGFVALDRTSGSQRRASESASVQVGLENLARTAGFRDPQRLVWAMEAEAVRDLASGPVTATDGDLLVALSIDENGAPSMSVKRAGKALTAVPAKNAKTPQIAQLRERARVLRNQSRRMRASLESACVLGEVFEPAELTGLLEHPILAPLLRQLVLVDAEGNVGFAAPGGVLITANGAERPCMGDPRIAHPINLLASGEWPDLQHAVMSAERRQPFKQLFRELYTLNINERDEAGVSSRRYAGHQLEARRAGGLFTSRGWVADFERGFARTFHQQKITAWCHLVRGWGSPTEVEDATIDEVTFHPAGQWSPMRLAEVPPRVFSETMRDLDLVVSVAHSGGVDPETSESSIEVRLRLVDETAELLGLRNVEVGGHHVRVKGKLGTYSIHAGSGVVHRIPGNAVCIVPVSAQHRGRIFLPFADDDPRSAEIVAKAVLLARDDTIKDTTILQQLVG